MDEGDRRVRNLTYQRFVELGRAPRVEEVADGAGLAVGEVEAAWRRLHEAHALVLHPDGAIRMANPFAAGPTPYRVKAGGRSWFGNCAWDAVGICAALGSDGDITAACPCCGDPITVEIRSETPSDETVLFHCLVPASSWWDDIGFT